MTYYQVLKYIFTSLIVLVPAYLLLFSRKSLLQNALLSLLCIGATINFDFRLFNAITLMQVLLVIISLSSTYKADKNHEKNSYNQIRMYVYILIGYTLTVTIIGYLLKKDYKLSGSIMQNELRPVVQILQFIFIFITFLKALELDKEQSTHILKVFHKALLLFALLGILQSLIYFLLHFDIFPMRKDFVSSIYGLSIVGNNGFLRATAGLGEPKQFAKFMAIGFALNLLISKTLGYNKIRIKNLLLFAVAIFFSSSTTGYLVVLVALAIFLFKSLNKSVAYNVFLVIPVVIIIPIIFNTSVVKEKILQAKNNDEIIGLENSDTATVRWLINEPIYIVSGVGLANTVAYANGYAPHSSLFINRHPYTLRRGVVRIIAEGGFISLILFSLIFYQILKNIRKDKKHLYIFWFFVVFYLFLTSEAIVEVQFILLALINNIAEKDIIKNENFAN